MPDDARSDLARTLDGLAALEQALEELDETTARLARRWRDSVEEFYAEALRRLVRELQSDSGCRARLRHAVSDPHVYAALRRLGLLRPSLQERVEQALDSVRPVLRGHGGDVELVDVIPPDRVQLRFLGNCDGCPASSLTFLAGVKKAIEEHCPEITRIEQLDTGRTAVTGPAFQSPFAAPGGRWVEAARLAEIPDGGAIFRTVERERLLIGRFGPVVSCFVDACAHLGLSLEGGTLVEGCITCPHHGFEFDLRSGECLTVPEVQLEVRAIRVSGERVEVRVGEG